MAVSSDPSAILGQWNYDFSDPDGPQMGTVALPGMTSVYETEEPVVIIADHISLGVNLPPAITGPVDLIVLCDRARTNFAERRFLVLELEQDTTTTGMLTIAAFGSKEEMPMNANIVGHVTLVQIPWLPTKKIQPPPLPAPSQAVLRAAKRSSGKRNAMAEIWASMEEIEYEQSIGGKSSLAMEGLIVDQIKEDEPYLPKWMRKKQDSIAKKSKLDNNTPVDDPCCPNAQGYGEYRDRELIKRQTKEVAGLKRQQHDHAVKQVLQHETQHLLSSAQPPPQMMSSSYNTQQLIWYYKDNTSGNMQGPFSGEQMMGWRALFPLFTPVRFGNGIFLPLSEVNFMNSPISPVPPPPQPPPPEKQIEDIVSVETRSIDNGAEYYELNSAQEALDTSVPLESTGVNVTDEEVRSRKDSEVDICIPPPSDDDEEENDDKDVSDKDDGRELDHCVPPPIDDDEGEESQFISLYPIADEDLTYPVDEDVPYPADVEYPVDDAYGYSDTDGAYFSSVGVTDNLDCQTEEKNEYTGDKAVVRFIPSNLRIKRKVAKPNKKSLAPTTVNAVADDYYSKFMDEITKLT